jgi:hypothetical protein
MNVVCAVGVGVGFGVGVRVRVALGLGQGYRKVRVNFRDIGSNVGEEEAWPPLRGGRYRLP